MYPTHRVFPVSYSTLDCQALSVHVLSHYAQTLGAQCCMWQRGISDVYLVQDDDGRQYILRVSHHYWRSQGEVAFELEFLTYLHRLGIPVAQPLPTRTGDLWVTIMAPEGPRIAALFSYAPGTIALGDLSMAQGKHLGALLAQIHRAGEMFRCGHGRPPLSLGHLLDRSWQLINPYLSLGDRDEVAQQIQDLKNYLATLPQTAPYWTVCWGDPHSGNVHFTADQQPTLFDFDQCGYGWRAFDIAKFYQVSLQAGLRRQVRDAFVAGYQSIAPLSRQELDSLQALTQTAHIWNWAIQLTHTRHHQNCRLDSVYFRQRLERLKLLRSQDWQLF